MTLRFQKERGMVITYLRNAARASAAATAFDDGTAVFDWERFAASGAVELPPKGHLDRIAELDRLMCSPSSVLGRDADGLDPEGVRLVLGGDSRTALLRWGVSPSTVEQIHDESRSLAFHTLVEAVGAPLPAGVDAVRLGVVGATLVARAIRAGPG
jgi:hypothetical protein